MEDTKSPPDLCNPDSNENKNDTSPNLCNPDGEPPTKVQSTLEINHADFLTYTPYEKIKDKIKGLFITDNARYKQFVSILHGNNIDHLTRNVLDKSVLNKSVDSLFSNLSENFLRKIEIQSEYTVTRYTNTNTLCVFNYNGLIDKFNTENNNVLYDTDSNMQLLVVDRTAEIKKQIQTPTSIKVVGATGSNISGGAISVNDLVQHINDKMTNPRPLHKYKRRKTYKTAGRTRKRPASSFFSIFR